MRLRIGLVSLHTSPLSSPGSGDAGGMNIVIRHQAEALAGLGHHVEIVTRRQDDDTPDFAEVDERITLRRLTAGPTRMLAKSQQDAHIEEFSAELTGLEPYDVVHSHHWMSGMAALPVARAWGVPHLQSYHSIAAPEGAELGAGEPPESPARPPGEALLARESDRVIAISSAEAATVVDRLGGDPTRVVVVRPGVDMSVFHPRESAPAPTVPERPGYLLAAARLQPLKGIDLAVEALALVPEELRPRLVVAGDVSDDFADYRDHLHRLVEQHNLAEDVHFIGPRTRLELAALLRGARICLVASHSETFGLIALEASASGVPVIASAAGGLVEAVEDGRTGLLLRDRDPRTWARAIERVLADDTFAAELGRAGHERARQATWELAARRLEDVYRDVVRGKR